MDVKILGHSMTVGKHQFESQWNDSVRDDGKTDGGTLERCCWACLKLKVVKTDTWVNIYLSGATLMLTREYTVASTCTLWDLCILCSP